MHVNGVLYGTSKNVRKMAMYSLQRNDPILNIIKKSEKFTSNYYGLILSNSNVFTTKTFKWCLKT